MVAVIVPSGDYESEGKILDELSGCAEVKSTMGLANIEAMDGYVLTDAVTPRQLAEMANLDYEVAKALYGAYAVDHDEYGQIINGLDTYKVPIYDMFKFLEQETVSYTHLDVYKRQAQPHRADAGGLRQRHGGRLHRRAGRGVD